MCHPLHLSLLPNQPRQHLALAINDFPPIFCIHCVQGVTNDYRYHEMYTLTVICELIFPGPCFCVNISINLNLQTTYFLVMFTRSFGFVVAVSVSFGFIGPSVLEFKSSCMHVHHTKGDTLSQCHISPILFSYTSLGVMKLWSYRYQKQFETH